MDNKKRIGKIVLSAKKFLTNTKIRWGSQNVAKFENGPYTGEISAAMLKEFDSKYVIVGHSERNTAYCESDENIADKFEKVKKYKMTPVLCVGETLIEREAGIMERVIASQLDVIVKIYGAGIFENSIVGRVDEVADLWPEGPLNSKVFPKKFLSDKNFIKRNWNALNILTQQASRVGAIDLGIHSINETENFSFFDKLDNDDFKLIYLLGADNINFEKKNKFVVYQGSHGDRGAEIADIILPGAAYTEKNGLFINLEGKLQSAYKASYPPGDAREDWIIFKDLANMMKKPLGYNNVKHLRESINKHIQSKINNGVKKTNEVDFIEENISVKPIDYYYTNSIARSSKVMSECKQISKNFLFTGIEKAS